MNEKELKLIDERDAILRRLYEIRRELTVILNHYDFKDVELDKYDPRKG